MQRKEAHTYVSRPRGLGVERCSASLPASNFQDHGSATFVTSKTQFPENSVQSVAVEFEQVTTPEPNQQTILDYLKVRL